MKTSARAHDRKHDPRASGEKAAAPKSAEKAAKPEGAEKGRKAERAGRGPRASSGPDLSAQALRQLYGNARGERAHAGSAAPEALWSNDGPRGKGHRKARDPDRIRGDLAQTQTQIDRAAKRLENMWRRGNPGFRQRVLQELERNGKLPPEVRRDLAAKMTRARQLEWMMDWVSSPVLRARLEELHEQVSEEIATTLTENGVELEFLKAVERAAGEENLIGSLSNLLTAFFSLSQELFLFDRGLKVLTADDRKEFERVRREQVETSTRDDQSVRLQQELERMVTTEPV